MTRAAIIPLLLVGALVACGGPSSIEVQPTEKTFYASGESQPFSVVGRDEQGALVTVEEPEWEVGDPNVVSVDDSGLVVAKGGGTTTVTARYDELVAQSIIRVIPIASVELAPSDVRLIGPAQSTVAVEAKVSDVNGIPLDVPVNWTSDNPSVAEVDGEGNVTSMASGRTRLVASVGGFQGEAEVLVQIRTILRVAVHPETTVVRIGENEHFSATVFDEKSLAIPDVAVIWNSSNPEVAQVGPNGVVKALRQGTCQIEASFAGKSASATVIVN